MGGGYVHESMNSRVLAQLVANTINSACRILFELSHGPKEVSQICNRRQGFFDWV